MPKDSLFRLYAEELNATPFEPVPRLWTQFNLAAIDRFWRGKSTLRERDRNGPNLPPVRLLWGGEALFFYFEF